MASVLTVTLNPALDIAATTPHVQPGGKLRCDDVHTDPGGGGVNVSRVINALGGKSTAYVVTGGANGAAFVALLRAEGVSVETHAIKEETRQSFHVTDAATGEQYRFVLPGPTLNEHDLATIESDILRLAANASFLVLSGSLPPGVPDDFYAQLSQKLQSQTVRIIVDTSGPPLRRIISRQALPVFCVRMNKREAAQLYGTVIDTIPQAVGVASSLVQGSNVGNCIVTLGAEGAVLATDGELFHTRPPKVESVSAVGAGDSFVGAFTLALANNLLIEEACRHGTAAAAATMTSPATALCSQTEHARILRVTSLVHLGS